MLILLSQVSNEPPLSPVTRRQERHFIEDNGPGIAKSKRDMVFEREMMQDTVAGSGLGLAVAREMISRMGGMKMFWKERQAGGKYGSFYFAIKNDCMVFANPPNCT